MKSLIVTPALAAVLSGSLLTGCSDPCANLTPTEQERQVVQSGGGVEREVNGSECELNDLDEGFQLD